MLGGYGREGGRKGLGLEMAVAFLNNAVHCHDQSLEFAEDVGRQLKKEYRCGGAGGWVVGRWGGGWGGGGRSLPQPPAQYLPLPPPSAHTNKHNCTRLLSVTCTSADSLCTLSLCFSLTRKHTYTHTHTDT